MYLYSIVFHAFPFNLFLGSQPGSFPMTIRAWEACYSAYLNLGATGTGIVCCHRAAESQEYLITV